MDHKRPTSQPPAAMSKGLLGDMRRMKEDGAASAEELRDFVRQLRGRSPKEMLGIVAKSNLFQGSLTATIWTVILLVVLTAVPFGMKKFFGGASKEKATAAAAGGAVDAGAQNGAAAKATPEQTADGQGTAAKGTGTQGSAAQDATTAKGDSPKSKGKGSTKSSEQGVLSRDVLDKLEMGETLDPDSDLKGLETKTNELLKDIE